MDDTAVLIDSIVRIRRNKVVQMVGVCLVCGAAFLFCVSQLATVVFPRGHTVTPLSQSSKPNLQDAVYDDVVPDESASDVDLGELNRGKRLRMGVDIAMDKYGVYNAAAKRFPPCMTGLTPCSKRCAVIIRCCPPTTTTGRTPRTRPPKNRRRSRPTIP